MSVTVPVPSTCPWTTWPPRRSSARRGSSRLTGEEGSSSPSVVSERVWCMTSASNAPPPTEVPVRQAPLTATESPSDSSDASCAPIRRRAPSSEASTASTLPCSLTIPVNISSSHSPFPEPRANEHVLAHLLVAGRERMDPVGDARGALALEDRARLGRSDEHRRDEEAQLVDLAGVEERTRQGRTTLD